jgi:hypothetical protein
MRFLRRPAERAGVMGAVLAVAFVALLLSVPVPGKASPIGQPSAARPQAEGTYIVYWNGVDVSTASSTTSAISIDFSQSANLNYNWTVAGVTISDARLQMYYFGFAVSTRDQIVNNPVACAAGKTCNIPLGWTPLSINYVLEGVYRLTASFIAPNGTTMFSENFYVRGNAAYGFVAVIPIVLLLIAIYEVYALVRSGRYALLGRKSSGPPPSTPPSSTPPTSTPPSSTSPTSTPATESAAPAQTPEGDSPPSGGGSS